jgi:hydrogenase maturation protein HypF
VVLLRKRRSRPLPEAIAPGNGRLGFMLPYTPLHYLLVEGFEALVMTSGNISDEPIQKENEEAVRALSGIAGAFLLHDRDVFMRVDDSVLMASRTGSPVFVRRARGFTPEPVVLGEDGPDVLGAGADMKNAFTLLKGRYAVVSQHIGDMENHETLRFFEETFQNLRAVYRAEPAAVAHDLHPGYFSTQWAREWAEKHGLKALAVQHHHAHVASVMAEKGIRRKVLGVSLDGTGYGPDGTLWGGEFLVADPLGYKRAGHFGYVRLPGGERAIREPWRTAVSFIQQAAGGEAGEYLWRLGFFERFGEDMVGVILKVSRMPEVSPLSSGAGRLFDAAASILGICDFNTFEGEAAMALEAAAAGEGADRPYPVDVRFRDPIELDFSYTLICLMNDMLSGVGREVMAARFQAAVAEAVSRVAEKLSSVLGITTVVLSGGVFQNDYMLGAVTDRLREAGLAPHTNRLVPPNDAGVSLGQAYVLRERLRAGPLP